VSNQFNMSQFKFTTAAIVMVVGGVVTLVGWFMPWISAFGIGVSGGSANLGILVLLGALAAAGAGAVFAYMKPRYHMAWIVAAGAGAVVLLVMIMNWGDLSAASSVGASIGIGYWLTGIGALVTLGGAYLGYMEAKGTPMA
jgi:hypothetical protein